MIGQHIAEFCSFSGTHRKNAFRRRVKSPCMTDLSLSEDPSHFRHDIVGGESFFFIYVNNSVVHSFLRSYGHTVPEFSFQKIFTHEEQHFHPTAL